MNISVLIFIRFPQQHQYFTLKMAKKLLRLLRLSEKAMESHGKLVSASKWVRRVEIWFNKMVCLDQITQLNDT